MTSTSRQSGGDADDDDDDVNMTNFGARERTVRSRESEEIDRSPVTACMEYTRRCSADKRSHCMAKKERSASPAMVTDDERRRGRASAPSLLASHPVLNLSHRFCFDDLFFGMDGHDGRLSFAVSGSSQPSRLPSICNVGSHCPSECFGCLVVSYRHFPRYRRETYRSRRHTLAPSP